LFKRLGLREIHSPTYNELPWIGVQSGRRAAASENTRWERIEPLIVEHDVRSALDIGANAGFFSFMLVERGVQTIAVEESTRSVRIGLYARKRSGLSNANFLVLSVTPASVELLPSTDCVLVLSVWHHFVRDFGLEGATEILDRLWARTGKVLFFETGENEMPDWWQLPEMTPDPQSWLTNYLAETCTGGNVIHLGLHDAFDPDDQPCRRNLFAVVRGADQQQV
jgi:SAM-dependent methyltransferase